MKIAFTKLCGASLLVSYVILAGWQGAIVQAENVKDAFMRGTHHASLQVDQELENHQSFNNNERNLAQSCKHISCDFSTLIPNLYVTRPAQREKILADCGFTVRADEGLNINVFDSANIVSKYPRDDPDLGAPNRACGSARGKKGPGRGDGGKPGAPWPNCDPQGNLLIIQNSEIPE